MSHPHHTPSYLILGAAGRLGLAFLQAASKLTPPPQLHVLCRHVEKLPSHYLPFITSTIQGDARSSADVALALEISQADVILMAIGSDPAEIPHGKMGVRESVACAVMDSCGDGGRFEGVGVVAVVMAMGGLGWSRWRKGRREELDDLDGMERVIWEGFDDAAGAALIVGIEGWGKEGGGVVEGGGGRVGRADVARFIVNRLAGGWRGGRVGVGREGRKRGRGAWESWSDDASRGSC